MPRITSERGRPPHPDVLTLKEWKVLALLRQRLSNREIAGHLGVSVNTVRSHVSSILGKLRLEKRKDVLDWPGMPGVWGIKGKSFGEQPCNSPST